MTSFEDPFEGITTEIIRKIVKLSSQYKEGDFNITENLLSAFNKNKDGTQTNLSGRTQKIIELQSTHYVLCWFHEVRESMAMWNLYSNQDGVAIKIPFKNLNESLVPDPDTKIPIHNFYCGKVDYQDFLDEDKFSQESLNKVKKVGLRKDKSYAHEKEVRYVIKINKSVLLENKETAMILSKQIDLSSLEMKVVCHPRMEKWKKENIKKILRDAKLINSFSVSEIQLRS
ncbi:hypothetical protein GCM10007415_34590 [Parapedobacter pyrenivorans]|uniref:DUF2971 domain-containing protein n=1 Tax=Parapedobacter pyrenivorans TaxID=1305674 RepID=A0A917HYS3_9SPHI|nr:DUF2971 domain-containing protein [Parapedobacter pyrenivorans]GGG96482.1 hypothetical protein GCM10007415_34590 [Parapedobacter pyrenivorans]